MSAVAALKNFLKGLQQLRHANSVQEVLQDPAGRLLVAGVLGLLLVVLYFLQPKPEDEAEEAAKGKPKERDMRGFTRVEVAQHKSEDDLWLIIKNKGSDRLKVYDVTSYIEHHPGGDAIFTHAGDDCTEGFLGIQHPPTVYDLVEQYCIGWLEDP